MKTETNPKMSVVKLSDECVAAVMGVPLADIQAGKATFNVHQILSKVEALGEQKRSKALALLQSHPKPTDAPAPKATTNEPTTDPGLASKVENLLDASGIGKGVDRFVERDYVAEWKGSKSLRAEWPDAGVYAAFMKAQDRGCVRIVARGTGNESTIAADQDLKAIWASDEKLRAEFGEFSAFEAFETASRAGRIKLYGPGRMAAAQALL